MSQNQNTNIDEGDAPSVKKPLKNRSRSGLLEFFGSMNLAITLLVAVAIAAVIGTVLQQGLPYKDYIVKFGPFWFDVFKELGLYNIYGSAWFLTIVAFLLTSTAVCIYRNAPIIYRDMTHFRVNVQEKSLRAFHLKAQWVANHSSEDTLKIALAYLKSRGYRIHQKAHEKHTVVAAMKGEANRLGYLFTHAAIVVICIGALIDSNIPLKIAEFRGEVQPETRNIDARQVPEVSRLSAAENSAFRGNISLPEKTYTDFVNLYVGEGYLIQELPFTIKLQDFRIEHYASGQPKSFESDLIISAPNRPPLMQTIAVNHPLSYDGYTIYQSGFGDGGSLLHLNVWPLDRSATSAPETVKVAVYDSEPLQLESVTLSLELGDFRRNNIQPVTAAQEDGDGPKFQDIGPSFTFKLRRPDGRAREFLNYMAPVLRNGRYYFLSGVRDSVAEEFHYLAVPVDEQGGMTRFMHLLELLHNPRQVSEAALRAANHFLHETQIDGELLPNSVARSIERLVTLFATGGFGAVTDHVLSTVPEPRQEEVGSAYVRLLRSALKNLYIDVLVREGLAPEVGLSNAEKQFFDDAVNAIDGISPFGAPAFLQLARYEEIQASNLQVTVAPGRDTVYVGCVLLVVGIFMLFYLSHRRLWVMVTQGESGQTRVVFAGSGNRNTADFEQEFEAMRADLKKHSSTQDGA
ncbi:MAG: cytochrome c biogenesis protein ResB [Gammaproteobacteria bacterium]|nr:cytochrome c biogenesis protein ResB [Gammaproteobacteria bacterium]